MSAITTAARLSAMPVADAMIEADKLTGNVDQDWNNEATVWTFEDGSQLRVSGPFSEEIVKQEC